jgi:hypothetical protein
VNPSDADRLPEPTDEATERLRSRLRLTTPLIAVYDSHPSDAFEPLVEPKGTTCCFAYYGRWLVGETLVLEKGGAGCQGAYRALGLEKTYPPYMAHFRSTAARRRGRPPGEPRDRTGLSIAPNLRGQRGTVPIGPLRLSQ